MNPRLRRMLFLALLACLNTSCATKALIKAANGNERETLAGVMHVQSASREGNNAYICFQRVFPEGHSINYSLMVPTAENQDFYVQDASDRPPILSVMTDQLRPGPCKTGRSAVPVIEVSDEGKLTLKSTEREAVYVQYVQGSLRNLGYVSSAPLHNNTNHHSYAIDLGKTGMIGADGKKRPYLLLLLPISVAADTVTGVGVLGYVLVQGTMDSCSKDPKAKGCRGP
ncbi:MAG: hypothetical protein QM776_09200 [Rhodocyclaceae bacterium]